MQYKKIISLFTAFVTATCCTIPTTMAIEETSKIPVVTAEESPVSVYDEYREWSQLDPRWGNTPMGGTTIRSSGCLLTSLAIFSVHSGSIDDTALANMGIKDIEEFNPSVLANAYTGKNGFSYGGGIVSWGTISQIIPNVTFGADKYFQNTEKTAVAEELRALMAEGWHIIARVNNGGYHWAYIESVDADDSIIMCDPAKDTHNLYEAYPDGLQGEYWMLKGTNPPAESVAKPTSKMEIGTLPFKTSYLLGEKPDFTGGTVVLSGLDSENNEWTETVDMTDEDITIDSSAFDSTALGEYEIIVKIDSEKIKAKTSFTVKVTALLTSELNSGEYYVSVENGVNIYSDKGEGAVQYALKKGNVINILSCDGDYGRIASTDVKGWVDMKQLEKSATHIHEKGDINNDGKIDKYDMSLLNTYLQRKEELPNGILTLTSVQLFAADLNGDGTVDLADVREYLMLV